MKLSNQAMGAIMMALQKSILEQVDVVPMLTGFDFQVNQECEELIVLNPPTFKIGEDAFSPSIEENINTTGSD